MDSQSFIDHATLPIEDLKLEVSCYRGSDKLGWNMNTQVVIETPETPVAQPQIIPGLNIILNPFFALTINDEFVVSVGGIYSESEDRQVQFLSFGSRPSSGPESDTVDLVITNDSGVTLTDVKANVVNKICTWQDSTAINPKADVPFKAIAQVSTLNPKFEETLGFSEDYPDISFTVGTTANLLIDDFGYDVYDVATETLYPKGEGLAFDGTTQYKMSDTSPYPGLLFILSENLTDSDLASLYVTNGSDVFDIKLSSGDTWTGEGEKIALSDSLANGANVTVSIRANPHLDVINPVDYCVEGLLQISGWNGTEEHITSIPLSAVIKDRIPGITAGASVIDDTTKAVLATFGITEIVIGDIS